jgi:hypothetical protein
MTNAELLRMPKFGKKSLAGLRILAPYEGAQPVAQLDPLPPPPGSLADLRQRVERLEAEIQALKQNS